MTNHVFNEKYRHAFILVIPDELGNRNFGNLPAGIEDVGQIYREYTFINENGETETAMGFILRAGPRNDTLINPFSNEGILEAQINFRDDPRNTTSIDQIRSEAGDTELIFQLLSSHFYYINRQNSNPDSIPDYNIPDAKELNQRDGRPWIFDKYNSNSYVNSLLRAANVILPYPSLPEGQSVPLWDNQLPRELFNEPEPEP